MNSQQLISKAERALRTGQPNLASLYMAKALAVIGQERFVLQQELRALRLQRVLQIMVYGIARAIEAIPAAIGSMLRALAPVGDEQ